jgi:hypothetical protein
MATKLRKLKIAEVSLVRRPANPAAHVLLHKSAGWKPCSDCPAQSSGGGACEKAGRCMGELPARGAAALRRRAQAVAKAAQPGSRAEAVAELCKSDDPLTREIGRRSAELARIAKGARR